MYLYDGMEKQFPPLQLSDRKVELDELSLASTVALDCVGIAL